MPAPRSIDSGAIPSMSINAPPGAFSSWSLAIHNMILSCGLTPVTTSHDLQFIGFSQTGSNLQDYFGYRLYAFNDSLQGNGAPVFIRVDYGIGTSSQQNPGIFISIGNSHVDGLVNSHSFPFPHDGVNGSQGVNTGSLGATWFTGSSSVVPMTSPTLLSFTAGAPAQPVSISMSGDGSWITMAIDWSQNQVGGFVSIERTKDANGNDDARGVLFAIADVSYGVLYTLLFNSSSRGSATVNYTPLQAFTPSSVPGIVSTNTKTAFSSSIGLGDKIMISPVIFYGNSSQPEQGLGMLYVHADDIKNSPVASSSFGADIFVPIRGQQYSYRVYESHRALSAQLPTNVRLAIRFEGPSAL